MLERHHVEAWVDRNLWLEDDFNAIVNDIMACGSDDEEVWLHIVDVQFNGFHATDDPRVHPQPLA